MKFPLDWAAYENIYDIRKLELEKLSTAEIQELRHIFEKKYKADSNTTKSWMENEYRLFIWFVFVYSKILVLTPEQFVKNIVYNIEPNRMERCFFLFLQKTIILSIFLFVLKKIEISIMENLIGYFCGENDEVNIYNTLAHQ